MYTGIVQDCLPIKHIERQEGLMTFVVDMAGSIGEELETGASVAINGVCFTVTTIIETSVSFDAIRETMELSNIGELEVGSLVNVERSAKQGVEVGGHIMSGHIIDTAEVQVVEESPNNKRITFNGNPDWLKYVFNKGFLGINGCSLTIADLNREASTFSVNLIPETLERTNFSLLSQGDRVNIEIENQTQVIVDTVERVLEDRFAQATG